MQTKTLLIVLLSFFSLQSFASTGQNYQLIVQPVNSVEKTRQAYEPLLDYLRAETQLVIELKTTQSFFDYWHQSQSKKGPSFSIDPAHIADFKNQRHGFTPLAKLPDVVSFSLVSRGDDPVLDVDELVASRIATLASPSVGAVRMLELFPNPARQPITKEVQNSQEALALLQKGKVRAAMVPTPMLQNFTDVNVIYVTEQIPHMAFMASPEVALQDQQRIQQALLKARKTSRGQAVLSQLKLSHFEPASNRIYAGYAKLLSGVWGYTKISQVIKQ